MNYNKACIILGVIESDTIEEIRKKYLKLITKYHPDTNQSSDATKKAQEINQAYDYLKEHYETERTKTSSASYYQSSSETRSQSNSYQQQYGGYYNGYNKYNQNDRAYYKFCANYRGDKVFEEYKRIFNVDDRELYAYYCKVFMYDGLDFLHYLRDEIEINKYCKILNKTKDSLFADYFKEQLYGKISFLDYVKERMKELEYLKKVR